MTLFQDVIGQSSRYGQMDLSLSFYGREDCDPGHSWGPGLRDTYLLHFVQSGKGTFRTGTETYELTAGQAFLIVPGTLVHYKADDQDPWTYTWIGFKGLQAKPLLRKASLDGAHPILETGLMDWFDAFRAALSGPGISASRDLRSQSLLYGLMADLIDCSTSAAPPAAEPSVSKQHYIRQATEYIETNYSRKITVQDIAQFVGLDRTYLSSLFKQSFGVSLQLFLLQFRMSRAQELLMRQELSVSDVSRSVGYADPFLFSKMFKKVTGLSPRGMRAAGTASPDSSRQ